jgi:hypothetical protein
MYTSDAINELAAALASAQAVMENATKDAQNPHFRQGYATLASVWEAARAPLAKNGLAVIQTARAEGSAVTVETMLTHKSGQWVRDSLTMTARDAGPQAIGSCITYGRRYGLAAVVGIAPEDDDAESATARHTKAVDVTTGQETTADKATAPAGYHYISGYRQNGEWHEASLLKWDAQGGALKVSTKKASVGARLAQYAKDGVPVKADVTAKKNSPGEAYLNDLHAYTATERTPPPPLTDDIDESSIPF